MSMENRKKHSKRMKLNNPMKNKEVAKKASKKISEMNSKTLLCFDAFGNLINEFKNAKIAGEFYNVHSSNINRAANKNARKSANLIWIYKDEFTEELLQEKIKKLDIIKKQSKESILKRSKTQSKKIEVWDALGNYIRDFDSIKECADFYKINSGNISKCCNGIYKTCKHMVFKFKIN